VFKASDDRISAEVLAAHRLGVAVRVDNTAAHMHHKFAIFDGRWLLNGSYNWTRSAAEHNEENLVLGNDASLLRQFQGAFETMWASFDPL